MLELTNCFQIRHKHDRLLQLDNLEQYPYFTRTVPPDSAVSEAIVLLLKNQGFTKLGCVYVNDPYGNAYKDGIIMAAKANGMEAFTSAFTYGSDVITSVTDIVGLSDGEVNAWVAVVFTDDLDSVMRDAVRSGSAGADHVWVFGDAVGAEDLTERAVGGTECVDKDCMKIAAALNGAFRVLAIPGSVTESEDTLYDRFLEGWASLDDDSLFLNELAKKALRTTAAGVPYTADGGGANMDGSNRPVPAGTDMNSYNSTFFKNSVLSSFDGFFYDASMQIGLGACKALKENGANFSFNALSEEEKTAFADMLLAGMTNIEFEGWSGNVIFDEKTGEHANCGKGLTGR